MSNLFKFESWILPIILAVTIGAMKKKAFFWLFRVYIRSIYIYIYRRFYYLVIWGLYIDPFVLFSHYTILFHQNGRHTHLFATLGQASGHGTLRLLGLRWRAKGLSIWQKHDEKDYSVIKVSNIFYVHPYLGRWSNLTNIFQMGWNHQPVNLLQIRRYHTFD